MNDLSILTELHWLGIIGAATGLITRLAKAYKKLPKGMVPYVALLIGYGITMGVLLARGVPLADAWLPAFQGVLAGALSVLGHEAFKPLLVLAVGEKWATLILGKLPKPKPEDGTPPPKVPPMGAAATVLLLCMGLASLAGGVSACTPAMVAAMLPLVAELLDAVGQAEKWLAMVDQQAQPYLMEHPELAADYDRVMGRAVMALDAARRMGEGAEQLSEEDYDAAFAEFRLAYAELVALLDGLGMTPLGFGDSGSELAALQCKTPGCGE